MEIAENREGAGCTCEGRLETESDRGARSGISLERMEKDGAGELLAKVLERDNLNRAYKRVKENGGAAGIDGMTTFVTINHDILINMLREEVRDESLLSLIRKCLKSGVMIDGIYSPTVKGSTQGSVVPVAVEHLPDEIRQNAGSERSQVRKVRGSYVTGWLGYYAIADMRER